MDLAPGTWPPRWAVSVIPGGVITFPVHSSRLRTSTGLQAREFTACKTSGRRARNADHAVELANRSKYGLAASIWKADPERREELAGAVEAGVVFVYEIAKSDARLPCGGVKCSGYGRELSAFGIREFVNIKTVWIKPGDPHEDHRVRR